MQRMERILRLDVLWGSDSQVGTCLLSCLCLLLSLAMGAQGLLEEVRGVLGFRRMAQVMRLLVQVPLPWV